MQIKVQQTVHINGKTEKYGKNLLQSYPLSQKY